MEGPEAVLGKLMERYAQDVLRMSCLLLGDASLAEDAVQETFWKAYRRLDSFRGDSSEKTWLMRIAINTCKDVRRTAWMRHVRLTGLPEAVSPVAPENEALVEAIRQLGDGDRQAVLLYYYQGMTVEETARAMGCSGAAVSKRLKRARARLKGLLEGGGEDA